jgi:anti-sigma regulatory factor (Ser/Thr protein kinase)
MAEQGLKFRIDLSLPFGRKTVRSARKAIGVVAREWRFTDQACREIELCFSEALQNAMDHGSCGKGLVRILCKITDRSLKIVIEDPGAGEGDIQALQAAFESEEEVPQLENERGRGIYLIRKLMNSASMECLDQGGIRIIMVKNRI